MNPETKRLFDAFPRWCQQLTPDEIQALVDTGRLLSLTHERVPDRRWGTEDDLLYSGGRSADETPLAVPRGMREMEAHLRLLSAGVELYRLDHDGKCPPGNTRTLYRELEEGGYITPPLSVSDLWGTDYLFRCQDGEGHEFSSAGPDKVFGTGDDTVFQGP